MKAKHMFLLFVIFFIAENSFSQLRIAVFPFQNMDGRMELNVWSYHLQDSLYKALKAKDPSGKYFSLVPSDSIEMIIAALNLDPTNPQYMSDMWKAAKMLNIKKIISGNFNIQVDKFLVNAYIYDVRTRLPDLNHQARDIFKIEKELFESVELIVKALFPAFEI